MSRFRDVTEAYVTKVIYETFPEEAEELVKECVPSLMKGFDCAMEKAVEIYPALHEVPVFKDNGVTRKMIVEYVTDVRTKLHTLKLIDEHTTADSIQGIDSLTEGENLPPDPLRPEVHNRETPENGGDTR